MSGPTNPGEPLPLFNRVVVGIGGAGLVVVGVKVAVGGRIGDRSGWSMDAPASAAISGGLFAITGLGLLIVALFWRRRGRRAPAGGDSPGPPPGVVDQDSASGTELQPPREP